MRTGLRQCSAGTVLDVCVPGTAAATDATCDGFDDDCDGRSDESYAPQSVQCGTGACAAAGTTICSDGRVSASCTPGGAAAADTVCNGIDDDCNGELDEDYVTVRTACGVGACGAAGWSSCQAGVVRDSCVPGTGASADTTCNAVDDDCNGRVDEDYVGQSTACGIGACAADGSTRCSAGSVVDSCHPNTPGASDSCNGIDDDCDGRLDEDFHSETVGCGVGVCAAFGSTYGLGGAAFSSCAPTGPARTTRVAMG